jgi:hypothetical protein
MTAAILEAVDVDATCPTCTRRDRPVTTIAARCKRCGWTGTALVHTVTAEQRAAIVGGDRPPPRTEGEWLRLRGRCPQGCGRRTLERLL